MVDNPTELQGHLLHRWTLWAGDPAAHAASWLWDGAPAGSGVPFTLDGILHPVLDDQPDDYHLLTSGPESSANFFGSGVGSERPCHPG